MTDCIDDRNYPTNLTADTPDTSTKNSSSKFFTRTCNHFADNHLNVRPLSDNHSATAEQISKMIPHGTTHISLGMETAWHLLTPNLPYAAKVNKDDTLKAVVLLTDGKQTSPGYGPNKTWSVSQAEANLEQQCIRMKAAGIRVVTVSFDLDDETNSATEKRLHDCASDNKDKKWRKANRRPNTTSMPTPMRS